MAVLDGGLVQVGQVNGFGLLTSGLVWQAPEIWFDPESVDDVSQNPTGWTSAPWYPTDMILNGQHTGGAIVEAVGDGFSANSGSVQIVYNGHASAAINWNDDSNTAQTKVRAVPGLSSVICEMEIVSFELLVAMVGCGSNPLPIGVTNSSLIHNPGGLVVPVPVNTDFYGASGYYLETNWSASAGYSGCVSASLVTTTWVKSQTFGDEGMF